MLFALHDRHGAWRPKDVFTERQRYTTGVFFLLLQEVVNITPGVFDLWDDAGCQDEMLQRRKSTEILLALEVRRTVATFTSEADASTWAQHNLGFSMKLMMSRWGTCPKDWQNLQGGQGGENGLELGEDPFNFPFCWTFNCSLDVNTSGKKVSGGARASNEASLETQASLGLKSSKEVLCLEKVP